MSGTRKRKRTTGMVQGSFFLHDVHDVEVACKRTNRLAKKFTPSVAKSWNQCGEGFQEVSPMEGSRSMGEELKVVRSLAPALHSVEGAADTSSQSSRETAEIMWSSSDTDLSDGEVLTCNLRVLKERRSVLKGQSTVNSYQKYICMLNSLTDSQSNEEELPTIDWDSVSDNEDRGSDKMEHLLDPSFTDSDSSTTSKRSNRNSVTQQSESLTTAEDILEFSSDNEDFKESKLREQPIPSFSEQLLLSACGSENGKTSFRSASNWLKSAQAFLQTPEKQKRKQFKTPEDSAKKRKKFVRGGLAERLNRLQCRERSAINFWRHQSLTDSKTHAGGKADILMVKVLDLHEECSMFVTLCQPLMETSTEQAVENDGCTRKNPLKILFTRETASHLGISAGDTVHVYPPWQKLDIQDGKVPVILCTYFSQKIFSKKIPGMKASNYCPGKPMVFRKAPMSLAVKFSLIDSRQKHHSADQVKTTTTGNARSILSTPQEKLIKVLDFEHRFLANSVCDSLLEVIESQGAAGWAKQNLKVVIQRVYCLPIKDVLHNQLTRSNQPDHSLPSNVGQQNARSSGLFSLIESLWPPLVPPKVHGQSQVSQEHIDLSPDVLLPAPSFCYVLAPLPGEGGVEVLQNESVSDLYRPSALHNLKHILQHVPESHRCSFSAEVIYKRLQGPTANHQMGRDCWLFVTDSTLQSENHNSGVPRTLSVCVTSFCVLGSEVIKSLNDETSSSISFKDAIVEKDSIVCAQGTVLSLQKSVLQSSENQEISPLTGNLTLDELSAVTKVNSLCTVQGTVIGVDEATGFSWIVCNRCGNGKLEKKHGESESFYCRQCDQSVMTPLTKMQLEVFLQYPVLSHSTVKIKLLEPSISSLLLHSSSDEGGYEIDDILGQELGPLSCYVRSVTNQPTCWIGLEEVKLLQVTTQPR
ncbi:DNA repair-scaffolding protein isoform X2 [Heterodontus francisci]|uniref:DNA repair-scaffolding protein isoform X2 n=1 Tax=Heterodontus francisci TaxID=7792 RepID=UPI00355C0F22